MADNHRIVPPNIAFSHNHVGLDIKEVSGLVVYKLCFLRVPGGFAGGALEATRQRQGLHSHLRKRFHPYLFYITFPKVLWLKVLEDPLSTEDTQKSQVTRPSNTPASGHNWSLQRRCRDRLIFCKSCWLTAWSGYWNKACDAQCESEKKKFISMWWLKFIFGKNRFSIKIEIILKFLMKRTFYVRENSSAFFFSLLFKTIKSFYSATRLQLLVDMMDHLDAQPSPPHI